MYTITPKKLFVNIRCDWDFNKVSLYDLQLWEKVLTDAGYEYERETKSPYSRDSQVRVLIGKTKYIFSFGNEKQLAIGWKNLTEEKKPEFEKFFADIKESLSKVPYVQFKYFDFVTVVNFVANSYGKDIKGHFYEQLQEIKLDSIIETVKESLLNSINEIK